tara:strand:- start:41 stop:427 length:387 start_codon:yes stop_codon:yes gene_type:complete
MAISTYFNNIDDAIRTFTQEGYSREVLEDGVGTITWDNSSASGLPTNDQIITKAKELSVNNAVNAMRETRNMILQESDWMANSDVTMSDDWKTYRQNLRDITSTVTDDTIRYAMGDDINHSSWPTKPS